ncbi:MAG: Sec-dependent nitrous-oxide reductase [Bacteriovoracaceae bacterium]|nr:Sec-dependent nitrous-oxide reductase [Bacteriovoracaceae bacterium]
MKNRCLTFMAFVSIVGSAYADSNLTQKLMDIAKERKLKPDDVLSAVQTFTPAGKEDEFLCVNSGGQAASAILYGVPSMRIYKYVPTAAHDPASGYMHDLQTRAMVRKGRMIDSQELSWADTHHPAFSETNGKYDGRYAFLNDKANPRIFVIDLKDFETKQVIHNPIFMSAHGGAFATPNTEYIVEGAQYAAPADRKYVPLNQENYNKHYRGGITFHKFDNGKGKIDPKKSFTVIAPPYSQDLSDAGKGESYGYSFTNSFCSERYIGTGPDGKQPPFEAGCSARDTDFMHVVHWQKAEELFKKGKFKMVNNHAVIPMDVAAKEGVLFLIPEPKSPHGNDVSPDGRFIIVAGKLDTHASVYDFRKIKKLVEDKDFAGHDEYGIPILDLQKSLHGQVQVGLGPLHTQYGSEPGVVYTSLYLDSQVVKWDYINKKVLDKVSVNYNIGHLVSMQGDSIEPAGKYLIALNKLAIDRFDPVGPLLPQNHQLIDTSKPKMRVIYDLPLPLGEPHYTVCIDNKKLSPITTYPIGTDPVEMKISSVATMKGKEKVLRKGKKVEIFGTLSRHGIVPMNVDVTQGDEVIFHLTNIEQEAGKLIKFTVNGMGVLGVFTPGKTSSLRFVASQKGSYSYSAEDIASPFGVQEYGQLNVKYDHQFENRRQEARKLESEYVAALFKLPEVDSKVASLEKLHPGAIKFEEYGCIGCHIHGEAETAPDLTDVTVRRSKDWIKKFVANPENYYTDPTIAPLVAKYALEMPNLEVPPEDIDQIIEYLDQFKTKK